MILRGKSGWVNRRRKGRCINDSLESFDDRVDGACDNEIILDGLSREHCVPSNAIATSYMLNRTGGGGRGVRVFTLGTKRVCIRSADATK